MKQQDGAKQEISRVLLCRLAIQDQLLLEQVNSDTMGTASLASVFDRLQSKDKASQDALYRNVFCYIESSFQGMLYR